MNQITTPRIEQLEKAAAGFKDWVQKVAPGARVVICGGAAIVFWGGHRTTGVSNRLFVFRRRAAPEYFYLISRILTLPSTSPPVNAR